MTQLITLSALVVALVVPPAWATFSDPVPANPCLGAVPFKTNLGVLDVSGDGGFPPPCVGVNAETPITCTSKEKAGVLVDFSIEYFDTTGALISPPVAICGVAPGTTITFVTGPVPAPWAVAAIFVPTLPTVAAPGCAALTPGCFIHGGARVLATSKKVQCSATRLDISGPCFAVSPSALATKELTIFSKKQRGD